MWPCPGSRRFVLTLLADFSKGVLAVWAALHLTTGGSRFGRGDAAVVAGHIAPRNCVFKGARAWRCPWARCWSMLAHRRERGHLFLAGSRSRGNGIAGLFAYACLPFTSFWPDHDGVKFALFTMLAAIILSRIGRTW